MSGGREQPPESDPGTWIRDAADYPDFPPRAVRKWARINRQLARYCGDWYRFLRGETDEPPRPSQVVGSWHLKIAQREWRKRNGIPEPVPVDEQKDQG
jgi:hypothetical protein